MTYTFPDDEMLIMTHLSPDAVAKAEYQKRQRGSLTLCHHQPECGTLPVLSKVE